MQRLDRTLAERWAALALANVARPFPYKLDQLLRADADVLPPRAIHPAFWGGYDWHSCVHMHWTLVRLLGAARTIATLPTRCAIFRRASRRTTSMARCGPWRGRGTRPSNARTAGAGC